MSLTTYGLILNCFCSFLGTVTCFILCDSFFHRKVQSWRLSTVLFLFACMVGLSAAPFLVGSSYGIKMLLEVSLYYIVSVFFYQERWDRRFFVIVTIYAVLFSYSYWSDQVIMFWLHRPYAEIVWNVPLYTFILIAKALFSIAVAAAIRFFHQPLQESEHIQVWVSLSAAFPFLTLFVLWGAYSLPNYQREFQVGLVLLDIVNLIALVLLDRLEQSVTDREQLLVANERSRIQEENIKALSQAYSTQRKLTHDFRAHLSILSSFLEQNQLSEGQAYLNQLQAAQTERILLVNSHHAAIDAVLNQKGYAGQQQGIDMRFCVNDLSALHLSEVDTTVVLANLLDNAIEACVTLEPQERWVNVKILYRVYHQSATLLISIVNPSSPVIIRNGVIQTGKENSLLHGYGLKNVKDILERDGAEYSFHYEDGRFIFTTDWPDSH